MGPDIFLYTSGLLRSYLAISKDKSKSATGVEPWSYYLHSCDARLFPTAMISILFKDSDLQNNSTHFPSDDYKKMAFIIGYLTHIAADQIIHPEVNKLTGPYYLEGGNREEHRDIEISQDYFLYRSLYPYKSNTNSPNDFFKQDFKSWANVLSPGKNECEDAFIYFLQRSFSESMYSCPSDEVITKSVENLLGKVLNLCNNQFISPYKDTADNFIDNENSLFKSAFLDFKYAYYYRMAVELATIYIIAFVEGFELLKKKDQKGFLDRFNSIINSADLGSPLVDNILNDSAEALLRNPDINNDWFNPGKFILKIEDIKKIKYQDLFIS